VWVCAENRTARRGVERSKEYASVDILCRVANGAEVSSSISDRLTDHIAIGVLSGLVHRDIVDDVINECGKREKRSRLLPAHVVAYYVLALNLFFDEAYEEVMRQLVNGLRFLGSWRQDWTVPPASALSQTRMRLGEAPLKLLFERIAVPMARPAPAEPGFGVCGSWHSMVWYSTCPTLLPTTRSSGAAATTRIRTLFLKSALSQWPNAAPRPRRRRLGLVATGEQTSPGS
jgi:hypothetical protein